MTITIPIIAADGAQSTVTLPAPTVAAAGNTYPSPGIWTTGGTVTDSYSKFADVAASFEPAYTSKPISAFTNADGSGITAITTPYGPGFQVVCTDTNTAVWSATSKTLLLHGGQPTDLLGTVAQWEFYVNLPTQVFATGGSSQNGWFTGLLWELHTITSSGMNLQVDCSDANPFNHAPTLKFERQINLGAGLAPDGSPSYDYFYAPTPIQFNHWYKVDVQVYWTPTSNGWVKVYLDGTLLANSPGPTMFPADGTPYLQYGYYAGKGGEINTVQFGPVVRRQFAALGS